MYVFLLYFEVISLQSALFLLLWRLKYWLLQSVYLLCLSGSSCVGDTQQRHASDSLRNEKDEVLF